MLRPIEHKHLPTNRLRRDQVRVLRHVPRAVHLPVVVNALHDLHARRGRERVPAELAALVVVRRVIELVGGGAGGLGDLDGGDLEVVLRLAGGVGAEEEAVGVVGFGGLARMEGRKGVSGGYLGRGLRRTIPCRGPTGR